MPLRQRPWHFSMDGSIRHPAVHVAVAVGDGVPVARGGVGLAWQLNSHLPAFTIVRPQSPVIGWATKPEVCVHPHCRMPVVGLIRHRLADRLSTPLRTPLPM